MEGSTYFHDYRRAIAAEQRSESESESGAKTLLLLIRKWLVRNGAHTKMLIEDDGDQGERGEEMLRIGTHGFIVLLYAV